MALGTAPSTDVAKPDVVENPVAKFLKVTPRLRPRRLTEDVWQFLEEYCRDGGLLDLGEDVASFAQTEDEIRASDLPLPEKAKLLVSIGRARVDAKVRHQKMQEIRHRYITPEQFTTFLADLHQVLVRHVGSPTLLEVIGFELMAAAERIFEVDRR